MGEEEKQEHPLYVDCIELDWGFFFYCKSCDETRFDMNLYMELLSNPLLNKYEHLQKGEINNIIDFDCCMEFMSIGGINRETVLNSCSECKLTLPFDMEFYRKEDIYLCKICYTPEKGNYKQDCIDSGFGSINDWVFIFGNKNIRFYCNINIHSPHYKKFAEMEYVAGLGDFISIISHTSIEDIFIANDKSIAFAGIYEY